MGDAQSTNQGEAVAEDAGKVEDVQDDGNKEDKLLPRNVQISELNEKAEDPPEHLNGLCEERVVADVCETNSALVSPEEDVPDIPETADPSKQEETPQADVEVQDKEPPNAEDVPKPAMSEAEAKMNEINESFKRFFTQLGVKLTVKKDSELEVTAEKEEGEASSPADIKDSTEGTTSGDAEQNLDLSPEQESADSTPSPTTTDITVEEVQKTTEETSDTAEVPSDEGAEGSDEDMSPIKRFFTTGIFSGLAKKKKKDEETSKEETDDKELVDMGNQDDAMTPGEAGQEQEHAKEELSPDQNEGERKIEILPTTSDIGTPEATDFLEKGDNKENIPISNEAELLGSQERAKNEAELLSSQERAKSQGSPLRKLLSGAGLKKLKSKRRRGKKAAETKLTESGEHSAEPLGSSTEGPSEGEEISNLSTEEHRKKADSSPPWEAFLCGSGKKRSRKTSDSEDETPTNKVEGQRSDDEHRDVAESPLESSQEGDLENVASSPEQAGSPAGSPGSDGSSTWKSLKKLVTPKRKAKGDDLGKDQIPSDSEITKEDSSFSIKKLIPGRKKRKTDGTQEQMSSDEADRGAGSDDEDSDTPAVVPLSEFDMEPLDDANLQSQAVVESPIPAEEGDAQQELSSQVTDLVIPSDIVAPDTESSQDNDDAVERLDTSTPVEEYEDLTDFISKHQQLSDIPEEGVIEESVATPISLAEEITRDDTIAEDFIELTSEAFTALEPIDDSLADETMVSAVSQLTESSKTSGNTTPVPAEHDVKVTEALLQEVVETICITSSALAVTTEDETLESMAVSVSPILFETSAERETDVLEAHAELDAVAICLDSEEFNGSSDALEITEAEDTEQPDRDMFYDSNEPFCIQEENASEDIVEEEKEKGFQSADQDEAAEVERAPVPEIITCQVEEDIDDIPIAETLDIPEPLIDSVMPEVQSPEANEAALNPYYDTVLAKTGQLNDIMVVIKNVPSMQHMDDHEIQVQVVDADIQSAAGAVETLIQNVPSTQHMDDHEIQVQVVDNDIEAAEGAVEETMIRNVPSTQRMYDHEIQVQVVDAVIEAAEAGVETLIELVSTDAVEVVDVCVEEEKALETLSATLEIEEDVAEEAGRVIAQEINIEQMENHEETVPPAAATNPITVSGEFMSEAEGYAFDTVDAATKNIQPSEEYLELESAVEDALVVVRRREEDTEEKTTQTVTHLVERPSNAAVVSSAVHLGAPSSLTLEVKLNFQFGQTKEVDYVSHPVPERIESPKRSSVSEIGVQATQEMIPIGQLNVVNTPDLQTVITKPIKLTDVQMDQPDLQVEITKPIKLTDVHMHQESGIQAVKAVQPTRQVEEEIDQDVWLDAEDNAEVFDIANESETETSIATIE